MSRFIQIGVLGTILLVAGCSPSPEETARTNAEEIVKAHLSDPDSAQFSDEAFFDHPKYGATICGQVNAKNRFGGYVGFSRFFVWIPARVVEVENDEGGPTSNFFESGWKESKCDEALPISN